MFSETIYQPDRFVGGDDPATTIRVLIQREHQMMHQNMRLLSLIAAAIKQHGGDTLSLTPEFLRSVPPRFGIAFRNDEVGNVHLSLVGPAVLSIGDDIANAETEAEAESNPGEPTNDDAGN